MKNQLINFCDATDENYRPNWFHEKLARILQKAYEDVKEGKEVRIILEVPPRHGKSEQATIKFPAWILGQSPEYPIIVSSYSSDLSETFGQRTRDLMNSTTYQNFFDTKLRDDSQSKGKWLTERGGGYTATGVGGSITGKGGKILIVDDPIKNAEEADSETIRQKIWDWWTTTFYTRQEGNSAIIVIMTRWHLDDLVGRLQEQEENLTKAGETNIDHWEVVRFPAIAEEDEEHRKAGEALWPEKFSLEKLRTIENMIGLRAFGALYQQRPIAAENAKFKQEYFTYFEEKDLPPQMSIDITVDPALSKKKSACNTSICAVGKSDYIPDWFVLDYKFGKMNPGELIDNTFDVYKECKRLYPRATIRVWIEGVAYQAALEYFFVEKMKKDKIFFLCNTFVDQHDKEQRISGLEPMYKIGVIKHRRWMKDLERELINFPVGATVDIADSLSFQLIIKMNTADEAGEESGEVGSVERIMKRMGLPPQNNEDSYVESTFIK